MGRKRQTLTADAIDTAVAVVEPLTEDAATEPTCRIWNQDCISGMAEHLADDSVHLTVTSIPFEGLFCYSGKVEDLGNNDSTVDMRAGRFALNMRFFTKQLYRVTAPGCVACVHLQQLLAHKNQHGFMGRRDFRGACVDIFGAAGFSFAGDVAIPKDPQALAQRLNLHSLQFKTGWGRTSTKWAMAPNDYVLVFAKPGDVEHPVLPLVYHVSEKPLSREAYFADLGAADDAAYVSYLRDWAVSAGAKNPGGWLAPDDWIKWANGVWGDILEIDVLDGARSPKELDAVKENQDEKHVCPLQLGLIRRFVLMYSNPISIQPNVTVLDPFMGIGSTAWVALGAKSPITKLAVDEPRNVVGFELKDSYHRTAVKNADLAQSRGVVREKQALLW